MNCTRRNSSPIVAANDLASVVLPVPGTSSINRCPRLSRANMARSIAPSLPTNTRCTLVRILATVLATADTSPEASGTPAAVLSVVKSVPLGGDRWQRLGATH